MENRKLNHDDYTVAWICPLLVEQIAAMKMLDKEHDRLPQPPQDSNAYTLGEINGHNVIIASLPTPGNSPTAAVITQIKSTFRQVRFALLVGIGGGVPTKTGEGPIRLGHVVVSKPVDEHSGTIQYDRGKAEAEGRFRRTGCLAPPPPVLLNAAQQMDAKRAISSKDPLIDHLRWIKTLKRRVREKYGYPGAKNDYLYNASYTHLNEDVSCDEGGCDLNQRIARPREPEDGGNFEDEDGSSGKYVVVHRGTIASGELVVKDALLRDRLAQQHRVLCFETEAAGALADFPCLTIRGISDYSDSHKNNEWHGYAAAVAAAYARELFFYMPVDDIRKLTIAETDVDRIITNSEYLIQDKEEEKIYKWLSPADPSTNYTTSIKKRHKGTGKWFLRSDKFNRWKHGPCKHLWLYGIPGCGKTILTSIIIEHLRSIEITTSRVVLPFFFDFNDAQKRSFEALLRSLITQLYQKCEHTREVLVNLWTVHSEEKSQPTHESLRTAFSQMVNETCGVDIVLDALDECRQQDISDLFTWMEKLSKEDLSRFHFITTSRHTEEIESRFMCWLREQDRVSFELSRAGDDIKMYVYKRLQTDIGFQIWRSKPAVIEEIGVSLLEKANGMFRLAACQLDILEKCIDVRQLRRVLKDLPRTLYDTYDRILDNIDDMYRSYAIRILQFLIFSERPLSEKEIIDAIAVDLTQEFQFDPEWRLLRSRDILKICPSLISFSAVKDGHTDVHLAHLSVREYFLSDRVQLKFRQDLLETKAREIIARVCLAYLSYVKEESPSSIRGSFPLAQYSAQYWMEHARLVGNESTLLKNILEFFQHERAYDTWGQLVDPDQAQLRQSCETMASPLYYAALFGFELCVKSLLEMDADVNSVGGRYAYPLQAAAAKGHVEVVKLLLQSNVDANAEGGFHGHALQAAAENGHEKIVELLIKSNADVSMQEWQQGHVLSAAARNGHKEVVELLLRLCPGVPRGNALFGAALQGHKRIFWLLLLTSTNVNVSRHAHGDHHLRLSGTSLRRPFRNHIIPLNAASIDDHDGPLGASENARLVLSKNFLWELEREALACRLSHMLNRVEGLNSPLLPRLVRDILYWRKDRRPRNYCNHHFRTIKSDNSLVHWVCNLCHSGPHWFTFECYRCKLKACRLCLRKL